MIIFGEIATGLFNYTLKPGGMSEERERELKTKKKWVTPQLTVLVRGKPEEGVLVTCKEGMRYGGMRSMTNSEYMSCRFYVENCPDPSYGCWGSQCSHVKTS